MEYKIFKDDKLDFIGSGTAGVAQRVSAYESFKTEDDKIIDSYALMRNDVMKCSQNQY